MNDLSPAASTNDLGPLPQWELGDLYKSPSAPELEADLARAATDSKALRKSWEGKLGASSGEALAEAIRGYEGLQDLLGRIGSYAQLVYAGKMERAGVKKLAEIEPIMRRLDELAIDKPPLRMEMDKPKARWVKPILKARVVHRGGKPPRPVRHGIFEG